MYREVIEYYGEEAQHRQAMEECAELIQAINKVLRYPTPQARCRLVEEIIDVEIMICQLKEMYGISKSELEALRMQTDNRLFKRLEGAKRG